MRPDILAARRWLREVLAPDSVFVLEAFLFGSFLVRKHPKDVDLVVLLGMNGVMGFIDDVSFLREVEKMFHLRFERPLHSSIFTLEEMRYYNLFICGAEPRIRVPLRRKEDG